VGRRKNKKSIKGILKRVRREIQNELKEKAKDEGKSLAEEAINAFLEELGVRTLSHYEFESLQGIAKYALHAGAYAAQNLVPY